MRLKALDIQGFKSFADRIRLDFDDGITAVIGPNGSGKSNIADAVRWVLGEQSTKTLRGGKMEDVIFGGTQERKAMGVASVSLIIDNSDHSMTGIDAEEVAVTRRLYRSGESEYRINGNQVRLKDVAELFMDTGLGRDGYSIIGQGRVAEIVSARSRERREIFEEAAGIAKFRYRKNEAERRLAMAEDNLVRLRDILSELDVRVGPLKVQSEKAKKYLEMAAEKKSLEVSVWLTTLAALREKTAAIEDKLLLAQADFNEADEGVKQCESDYNEQTERGRALMVAIEEMRSELSRRSQEAASYQAKQAVLQNDIGHFEDSIKEINIQMEQAGQSKEELAGAVSYAKAHLEEKQSELLQIAERRNDISRLIADIEDEIRAESTALEALRTKRSGAFEAIEGARLQGASAATLLGESRQRAADMANAVAEREKAVEDARKQQKECEELISEIDNSLTALDNSAKGYLLKQSSRAQRVDEFDGKANALLQRINEKRQRAKLLSDMDKNMEGFGPSIKFIMNQSRGGAIKGVHGPVSSLVSVSNEYATAIETALGVAMQNIVVENEDTGKRAIALLSSAKAGRATFLPLTAMKGTRLDVKGVENMYGFVGFAADLASCDERYRGVIEYLLGRIVIAEDIDGAVTIAKKFGYRFRVVTLDGQVINAGGSMTGGYTAKSAGILGRQGEIDRLGKEAQALEEEHKALMAQRESAARELAALCAEIDAIEAQKKTCSEDRIRAVAELSATKQSLEQAEAQVENVAREREELSRRIEEMQQKSTSSKELAETLSAALATLQDEITAQGERLAAVNERKSAAINEQQEQATLYTLCQRDIEAAEAESERLAAQQSLAENQSGEQKQRVEELSAKIAQANAAMSELSERLKNGQSEESGLRAKTETAMREREESEKQCAALRSRERELSARRDGLYREVVRLGEQKNASETEREGLVSKLYDEYELTQSAAEEIAESIEDLPLANRRLSELRGRIKALGSVNVDSIEEYKEVYERHSELSRQMSDVEGSKAELSKLINELTGEMRSIFSEKFEAINTNFGKTFRELFEGGSASLSLTDPSDVLESGIEITVHPPGKLIKNLASLSGGEQAFVAIAIFFSILKVNPSPFCLMDEIEAALDDVNVARFAAYLHTLTDKTQFITITHRRGTMEEADVLYGVTMQEEGVSKLLSLKVTEIEKSLGIKV